MADTKQEKWTSILLEAIRIHPEIQSRLLEGNTAYEDNVKSLTEWAIAYPESDDIRPIIVVKDAQDAIWLAAGHQRYAAFKAAKRQSIPAYIRPGTVHDAWRIGIEDNIRFNGVQYTKQEKRALMWAMFDHPVDTKLHDTEIGDILKIQHSTVSYQRNLWREARGKPKGKKRPRLPRAAPQVAATDALPSARGVQWDPAGTPVPLEGDAPLEAATEVTPSNLEGDAQGVTPSQVEADSMVTPSNLEAPPTVTPSRLDVACTGLDPVQALAPGDLWESFRQAVGLLTTVARQWDLLFASLPQSGAREMSPMITAVQQIGGQLERAWDMHLGRLREETPPAPALTLPTDFDRKVWYLGALCEQLHDFQGTGKSLRRLNNRMCRECLNAARRQSRARKKAPALRSSEGDER